MTSTLGFALMNVPKIGGGVVVHHLQKNGYISYVYIYIYACMQFFSLTNILKVMFQWHIHDNPVYPQNLLRTKGALGDLKKMALGGIIVAFLGDPERPHGISEFLRSFDSQSQHALVSSAARVIYSQLPSSCEKWSQIRGLFKRDIWFERETCGEESVRTEKNQRYAMTRLWIVLMFCWIAWYPLMIIWL